MAFGDFPIGLVRASAVVAAIMAVRSNRRLDRVLWLESDRMGHMLPAID